MQRRGSGGFKVRKRKGSPFWWSDFVTPTGERVRKSTGCRDREAALRLVREWARAAEHAVADAAAGVRRAEAIKLVTLAALYLAHAETHLSEAMVSIHRRKVSVWILPHFGPDRDATTITTDDVIAFRRWCLSGGMATDQQRARWRGAGPSVKTVNDCVQTLRRILGHGVELGHMPMNAAAGAHKLREKPEAKFRALDAETLDAWVAQLPDWASQWVRFAVATGFRRSEMRAVRWSDVDTAARVVRLRPYHDPATGRVWTPKGGKMRVVPLTKVALAVIDEMGGRGVGRLFGHHDMRASFGSAWKAAGFVGRVPSPHDLRHTAASRAAQAGATLVELMDWFGWESPGIAARYLHSYGPGLADMARRMDGESA